MYKIKMSDHYHDRRQRHWIAGAADHDGPALFETREAAQVWIDRQADRPYRLDHNEYARPTYTIVEVKS